MPLPAVRADRLSKQYRLGATHRRPETLVASLASGVRNAECADSVTLGSATSG